MPNTYRPIQNLNMLLHLTETQRFCVIYPFAVYNSMLTACLVVVYGKSANNRWPPCHENSDNNTRAPCTQVKSLPPPMYMAAAYVTWKWVHRCRVPSACVNFNKVSIHTASRVDTLLAV